MKKAFILFILFTALGSIKAQENFLQINGSTNINSFKCVNNSFKTPSGYSFNGKLPWYAVKVDEFDCFNRIMTKDFQKTLDSDNYPNLTIKILKFVKGQNSYNAVVEVQMMNRNKTYNVQFNLENGKYVGKKSVKFSEFNIKPPKKMGGMIVVKDDLNLTFSLIAK